MTTLDDAAERRCAELAINVCQELGLYSPHHETNIKVAIRLAWIEATEAAAKKCEAIERENIEWITRNGNEVPLSDGHKYADGASDGAAACAAAIRGGKL